MSGRQTGSNGLSPGKRAYRPNEALLHISGNAANRDLARVDGPALRVQAKSGSSAAAGLQLFRWENMALDSCAYFQCITASLIHTQLVYELLYSSA